MTVLLLHKTMNDFLYNLIICCLGENMLNHGLRLRDTLANSSILKHVTFSVLYDILACI